jgi:hypothetical protein
MEQVDAGTWAWIRELLSDPEALRRGLRKHREQKDNENAPRPSGSSG